LHQSRSITQRRNSSIAFGASGAIEMHHFS
jgi:hypothetical protein